MALSDFKKKEKVVEKFGAPATGLVMDLSEVPGQVFAQKLMGDGFAIDITEGQVFAPISDKVTVAFPTGHAFDIKTKDGLELLIHIVLDTVELNGQGFDVQVKVGDKIKQGDLLVKVDIEYIKQTGKPVITPVIFASGQKIKLLKDKENVTKLDPDIFEYE